MVFDIIIMVCYNYGRVKEAPLFLNISLDLIEKETWSVLCPEGRDKRYATRKGGSYVTVNRICWSGGPSLAG